ncbi:HAMP domain-containing protein [Ramlibacter rhizophilus]|uniref:histidine kinase n=2 Tax=Ramlibacter rhizophilus TaxID=1781167 RepID=A0A4Z0BHG2_9BURK|nr:HAMP domain-containing protein [Ramlibacter rhizophilus]
MILEQLMAQSSAEATRALELTASAQALTARSVAMERAARQALVFNDPVLMGRFREELQQARNSLQRMRRNGLAEPLALRWLTQLDSVTALLPGPQATALDRERQVALEFRELDFVNSRIARAVQDDIEQRDRSLRESLAVSRSRLIRQVALAIFLAAVLAITLGLWLARPFKRMERAVVNLGENRLEDPIDIRGPADVRRLGQQLEWLRLRLMELDADKARFLRHVSHELKTPLAALREGVSLLEEGVAGELTPDQQEVARILRHNTALLQRQIEALLNFNAAAFEARQLRRERTDLLTLLHEQVEAQRLQWQAGELQVQVTGPSVWARVDADKLGTAVANLLSNAIRFAPPGSRIEIALSTQDGRARIDIRDQGPGIAPEDRDRVFEPFYRGERQPQDAVRGTGIGLSIVQEYIAAHGGQVSLLDEDGPGAHFRIELPHAN